MASNVFNFVSSSPETTGTDLYLQALHFIVTGKEELASYALNMTRNWLLQNAHTTQFSDTHTQSLMPDLTVNKFNALYGDLKYGEAEHKKHKFDMAYAGQPEQKWDPVSSPWIKDPELLKMIADHIDKLGNFHDKADCAAFLNKARNFYDLPPVLGLVA